MRGVEVYGRFNGFDSQDDVVEGLDCEVGSLLGHVGR